MFLAFDSLLLRVCCALIALAAVVVGARSAQRLLNLVEELQIMLSGQRGLDKKVSNLTLVNGNYQQLLQVLLPLWQRQAELARNQLEASVRELTTRLSDIHQRLKTAVDASCTTSNDMKSNNGLSSVIQFADSELGLMIRTLGRAKGYNEMSKK